LNNIIQKSFTLITVGRSNILKHDYSAPGVGTKSSPYYQLVYGERFFR